MSASGRNHDYDGGNYEGHLYYSGPPALSAQSSNSTTGMGSNLSSPTMTNHGPGFYPLMDPVGHAQPPPMPFQTQDWYLGQVTSELHFSEAMLAELELSQAAAAAPNMSPLLGDNIDSRRESVASLPEVTEWQEKVRTERRKVQNRAAQRAYRERKEKAIVDLREQLDQKENQYKALQTDHKLLQEQYDKLLAAKQESSGLGLTATCSPSDLLSTDSSSLCPDLTDSQRQTKE